MSPVLAIARRRTSRPLPSLDNGDCLTQPEFHRRYALYPEDIRIELLEGLVVMSSPVRNPHATFQGRLNYAVSHYESATLGIESAANASIILPGDNELQPDAALRILTEHGGRTRLTPDEYILGGPEWVGEIAYSSAAIDLHLKKEIYQRAGIHEYFVLAVAQREIHWFNFKSRRMIVPDADGVYKSRAFPGFWIHGPALLARDGKRLIATVQAGLASREHALFVRRLEAARRKL